MSDQHTSRRDDAVNVSTDPAEVDKVYKIMSGMDIAMLTTVDAASPAGRLTSRPLSTQVHEEDGDVLFFVRASSAVVRDITANPNVNVAYASTKAWVSLSGTATLVDDRELITELWSKGVDAFMDGGPENPDNVLIKVHGDTAEYWGGTTLVGTVVSTVKAVRGRGESPDAGPTVVDLP